MVAVSIRDVWRVDVDNYRRMADAGLFDDGPRVELIEGVIVAMNAMHTPHTHAVNVLNKLLCNVLAREPLVVRPQEALTLSRNSEPEPDLAVVTEEETARTEPYHPATALLVVEVADATLRKDRAKGALYAAAGVPEYWIVNVKERVVEVMTEPKDGRYGLKRLVRPGARLHSVALPRVVVSVSELFR